MYKDTLLGLMASSEKASVVTRVMLDRMGERCCAVKARKQEQHITMVENQTVPQRDGFLNYKAEIYHNPKVYHLSLKD